MLCQRLKLSSTVSQRGALTASTRSVSCVSFGRNQCKSKQRQSHLSLAVPTRMPGSLLFKQPSLDSSSQWVEKGTALLWLFASQKHQGRCRRHVVRGSSSDGSSATPSDGEGKAAEQKAQVQLQTKTRVEFTCNKCGGRTVSN